MDHLKEKKKKLAFLLLRNQNNRMKEQNQESETITISKEKYYEMVFDQQLLNALLSVGVDKWEGWSKAHEELDKNYEDVWNEIAEESLRVGMHIGVVNSKVIERGEIISIDEKLVRVMHDNKSVSAYQLGYFKFVELA